MPVNTEIDLKLINDDLRYDLNKHIFINTNLGEMKLEFKDALEITRALFDATFHLDKQTEELLCDIENEIM